MAGLDQTTQVACLLLGETSVGKNASPRVESHAGLIEHTIHQRINALLTKTNRTSDHVTVSVYIRV
jgi:hypothetical protein